MRSQTIAALRAGAAAAESYFMDLDQRRVSPSTQALEALSEMHTPLGEGPTDPQEVVSLLHRLGSPAAMGNAGGRFFGLVVGGALPATIGARVLSTAWDQIVFNEAVSPVGVLLERVSGNWIVDVLGLPNGAHVSFVTGATMGNFTCLAAAREHLLRKAGYSVSELGLWDAPKLRVVVSDQIHVTVVKALTLLGWGTSSIERVRTDEQGRVVPEALPKLDDKTIVILQAGNVNSGSFDPFEEICQSARASGSWVHIDGAFGLWAAASAKYEKLTRGLEMAHSWTVDGHKWLNTPYDCAMAITAEPVALHQAMATQAPYLKAGGNVAPKDMGPEFSRSARGVEVWAALKSLGRKGLANLIERSCEHAIYAARNLEDMGFEILNDVVLNQVVASRAGSYDHEALAMRVQQSGDTWFGTTTWRGRHAIRIAVSNWSTTRADIDRAIRAIGRSL